MKIKSRHVLIAVGAALLTAALVLTVYNIWDESRAARLSEEAVKELETLIRADAPLPPEDIEAVRGEEVEIPDYIINPKMDMPTKTVGGREYIGVLKIPSRSLILPIISEWSYADLKAAPCRYSGSPYLENFVIAGHNYKSHFSPIKSLSIGDEVIFTDIDGNVFSYSVAEVETLMPTDVEKMTSGDYPLTLFTCTYGGKSRLAVRCEKAS